MKKKVPPKKKLPFHSRVSGLAGQRRPDRKAAPQRELRRVFKNADADLLNPFDPPAPPGGKVTQQYPGDKPIPRPRAGMLRGGAVKKRQGGGGIPGGGGAAGLLSASGPMSDPSGRGFAAPTQSDLADVQRKLAAPPPADPTQNNLLSRIAPGSVRTPSGGVTPGLGAVPVPAVPGPAIPGIPGVGQVDSGDAGFVGRRLGQIGMRRGGAVKGGMAKR